MSKYHSIGIVILAAGEGKRMNSHIPKVMHLLHGKPLVEHVVGTVELSECCTKPVVIVSPNHTLVQDHLGDRVQYVIQPEQLGTGHATAQAEELLKSQVDDVIVLYGDMPFVTADSIKRLSQRHVERGNTVTMMTITVPHFEGVFKPFYSFSRVIRGGEGNHIQRIVECKDATENELEIKEVNPCYFCFSSDWLWKKLKTVDNNNIQKEYYLPDVVKMAIDEGESISSIDVDYTEAVGINTKEDLDIAHQHLTKK
ncbi:NTP transferase domain-containing protein [Patescibacteria group bacterium]|nr:NTP transferase domain-containing protein [Patescibacteria group bacterium]MBU1722211.1 NTP transferase domain-containing protein [Patescibacteria group bacterium]MBU1901162.1 NTP transferase domain-containing protein [Patescibacteria group bacterium]